jgi:hypothetical protein
MDNCAGLPDAVAAACQALAARLGSSSSAQQQQQQQELQIKLEEMLVTSLLRNALRLLKCEYACCINVAPLWTAAPGLAMAALRAWQSTETTARSSSGNPVTKRERLDEICSFMVEAVNSANQQQMRDELCEMRRKKQQQLLQSFLDAQQQQQQCSNVERLQPASIELSAPLYFPSSTAKGASSASRAIVDNAHAAAGCADLTDMALVAVARLALKVHQCCQNASRSSSSNGRRAGFQQQQQQQTAAAVRSAAEQLLLSSCC